MVKTGSSAPSGALAPGAAPVRGGAVGSLMRSCDWSGSDVGPPESWSTSLRSYVAMILEMPTPAILFWGPRQIQLYNDGYAVIMGPRHPAYLAASYEECWPETYPVIYPWMQKVLERGEVVHVQDHHITVARHGFSEEAYFTFTLSPLRDDDGAIAGIFQPVIEVTDTVLAARRSDTLRKLAALVDSPDAVTQAAMGALAESSWDLPFALIYHWDESAAALTLAAHSGLESPAAARDAAAELSPAALRAFETRTSHELHELPAVLAAAHPGPWPEPTRRAYALPLMRSASDLPRGAVIFGVSSRLHFDDRYRDFMEAAARELAANRAVEQAKAVERDLLAREKGARRVIELQKEELAALLTQAPTPMVVLRGDALVVERANPSACRVYMRDEAELVGKPLFDALPEIRSQVFEGLLRKVYRSGETFVGTEVLARLVSPSGRSAEVYFNFVYAPLRGPTGEVDGILVIAVDVTEQVRAREQVEELRIAAEAANRAKDQFLAVLGHELRNPLAPILTALQVMRLRGVTEVEREREIIERQAEHLIRLVDDLLDVSRIISGKIALDKRRVELEEVVARAVEMALPMLEQRHHELVVEVGPGAVLADVGRLSQALANLLTNAAKYTEPGGRVTVSAERRGDQVRVSVRDTGIGIDPQILPRLFDAFVQEPQALDRSQGGLGLGLAIVRGIVELHGGSVEVWSEGRGRGSELTIGLPAAPTSPVEVADVARAGARDVLAAEEGRSVLLVDDNRDAADLLAASLELAGHQVRVAYDGPSALTLARDHNPDIALLDIGLPVMDGYELARRLREEPALGRLPLVAITGYGQDADRQRSGAAGFDAHLVKPVELESLRALVLSLTR